MMEIYVQMVNETMLSILVVMVIAVVGCVYLALYDETDVEKVERPAFHSKSLDEMKKNETWNWGRK